MRDEKQLLLDEIKQKIDSSTAMIIARYDRLPPNLSWDLRDQLLKSGSQFEVVRKRVFLKAAEQAGLALDESLLKGHIGVAFIQKEDALASAKVLVNFSEANQDLIEVLCGQIEGKLTPGSDVVAMSKLPGINEMRSQLIALLVSPMSQTLSVLEAVIAESSAVEQKPNE